MVWLAPVPRNSGGRSAVSTRRGILARSASMTAGWKLAAAVPEVQSTAAGLPDALAIPRAQNAADRSSMRTWIPTPGWPAKAMAIGVDREPGAMQAWASPLRTNSSTRTIAKACPAVSAFMPALSCRGVPAGEQAPAFIVAGLPTAEGIVAGDGPAQLDVTPGR